ncbi:MAG: NHL repeat-containing protein, partial [Gemmatimonadetes bacterium]|nr:NHL repeat-containing protein [Gemmatimonadota bacterium]
MTALLASRTAVPSAVLARAAFPLVAVLVALAGPAGAQVIDFETLPDGTPTVDLEPISTQYDSLGVSFSLRDASGALIGFPRIAKAGAPQTAFEGCSDVDTPLPNLGLGSTFLTDDTSLGVSGDLRIDYATPVAQASGSVLDIDCRVNGLPPCEQWTITAYDSTGIELDSRVLDAPNGPGNPACLSPGAGPGDAMAFGWSFDLGSPVIRSIVLRYTGEATGVGLAFDNFSVASLPGPPVVSVAAEADTVCTGEELQLTASLTGGLGPYSYQWQVRQGGGAWFDLGIASTESVVVTGTSEYRVLVTDATSTVVISDAVPVVATDDALCDASLLISCSASSSVVRYSFRSRLVKPFVTPGSGGLNATSDLVTGADGFVYVVSQNDDRVRRYDGLTGAFIDVFVAAGSGGLNVPVGLDFGPDGSLYVASAATNAVLRYDGATGAFLNAFVPAGAGGLSQPTGIRFGPGGDLFVASWSNDRIIRYDGATGAPMGDFVPAGSGGLDAPRGVRFGPDGDLYVTEQTNDSVRRYDGTTGAFLGVFVSAGSGGLDRANDIFFGLDGLAYVASFNNDRVLRYDGVTATPAGELDDALLSGPAWFAQSAGPRATAVPPVATSAASLFVESPAPNPFTTETRFAFTLARGGPARVTIVDVTGRRVAT